MKKIILSTEDIKNIIHENNIYKENINYLQKQIEEISYENYNLKNLQEGYILLKVYLPDNSNPGDILKGRYNDSIYRFAVPNNIKDNKYFYVKILNPQEKENNELEIDKKYSFSIDELKEISPSNNIFFCIFPWCK